MGINYVLIFTIIFIIVAGVTGYCLGTARMILIGIVLGISVFLTVIICPGMYKVLNVIGVNKAIYNNNTADVFEQTAGAEYDCKGLDESIVGQTAYIEKLSLPKCIRLAMLENNNSKIYQCLDADNFKGYTEKFYSYIIACMTSFFVSLFTAFIVILIISQLTGVNAYIAAEKNTSKSVGVVLGVVLGVVFIWLMLAIVPLLLETELGITMHNQIKSSRILNYMYENNIIVNVCMSVRVSIWDAVK